MASGLALAGLGGGLGAAGNYFGAKKKQKQLKNAYNDYILGSQDAQGNQLNFNKNRGWGFDLSGAGKAEQALANKGAYIAAGMTHRLPSQTRNTLTGADFKSIRNLATANQAAANRNALRTGSNLGAISQAYGSQGTSALQRAMQQNYANNNYAQMMSDYAQMASNMKAPLNSTQQQLIQQHSSLAPTQFEIQSGIADAAGQKSSALLQALSSIATGAGLGMFGYGQGKEKEERQRMMNDPTSPYNMTPKRKPMR